MLLRATLLGSACFLLSSPFPGPGEGRSPASARVWAAAEPSAEPSFEMSERDEAILLRAFRSAREAGLASIPIGDAIARIGLGFLGTPYEPGTLERPGPERLIANLRALDCVTFVEATVAIALVVHRFASGPEPVPADVARAFRAELLRLRYRGGVLDGYASRLHYFSEWMEDNARKGILELPGSALPYARPDPRPIHFMSRHPEAYPALRDDPAMVDRIREIESGLDAPRWVIAEEDIEAAAAGGGIRNGDIIAARSTVEGLDVAHTGIALWRGDRLHLLHAPLVGDSVEVSRVPLSERIRGIRSQDGVLVARVRVPGPSQFSPPRPL